MHGFPGLPGEGMGFCRKGIYRVTVNGSPHVPRRLQQVCPTRHAVQNTDAFDGLGVEDVPRVQNASESSRESLVGNGGVGTVRINVVSALYDGLLPLVLVPGAAGNVGARYGRRRRRRTRHHVTSNNPTELSFRHPHVLSGRPRGVPHLVLEHDTANNVNPVISQGRVERLQRERFPLSLLHLRQVTVDGEGFVRE